LPRLMLIDLVRLHCGGFGGQAIGNVLTGLVVLRADLRVTSVDDKLAKQPAEGVKRAAPIMNVQNVGNTLNTLGRRNRIIPPPRAVVTPGG